MTVRPLPVAVPDSHSHLDLLDEPVEELLRTATALGVAPVVTVGVDVPTSRWAAATAAVYPGLYAAVAVHPNETSEVTEADWDEIARLAAAPDVCAVGETGLDYYRDWAPPERQLVSFRRHIDIAKVTGRALVIHDRDAHAAVLQTLVEDGAPPPTVFHCFSGDVEMVERCTDAGYFMSFAGNVTFRNAATLREAALAVPAELLLVETDAPFLTPVPLRGRPNAPHLVAHTLRALAELRGVAEDELAAAVAANARRVFGW